MPQMPYEALPLCRKCGCGTEDAVLCNEWRQFGLRIQICILQAITEGSSVMCLGLRAAFLWRVPASRISYQYLLSMDLLVFWGY